METRKELLELEPLRGKLTNLKITSKKYEFTFIKTAPYRKGLLIIAFVNKNLKSVVASYVIVNDKSKGELKLNFKYKRLPPKISGQHKNINFNQLADYLKNL